MKIGRVKLQLRKLRFGNHYILGFGPVCNALCMGSESNGNLTEMFEYIKGDYDSESGSSGNWSDITKFTFL